MTKSFKDFATAGKYIKLPDIGDSIEVIVKVDPYTLKPVPGSFKDAQTGEPKLVVNYLFTDPVSNTEKQFSSGSQAFAQQMAKTKVGDRIKIVKIEKNGKATYKVVMSTKSADEIPTVQLEETETDTSKAPF